MLRKHLGRRNRSRLALALAGLVAAVPSFALETVRIEVTGDPGGLRDALTAASLVQMAKTENKSDPRDIVAAAQADYAQLLGTLYAKGYYSGRISIRVDGREASDMSEFAAPAQISEIAISVDPGPPFRFGMARVAPVPKGTEPPTEFRPGAPALAPAVGAAARAGVASWRDAGHAKAAIGARSIVADHAAQTLDVEVKLTPGPRVTFGELRQTGTSAVRPDRLVQIAGLPTGKVFSPADLDRAAKRLRRTGAFRSVDLTEAEQLRDGDILDIGLAVTDEKPRRFGFSGEIASTEGITVSGFWMHRNLLGGAERLRIDAEAAGIGSQSGGMNGGIDYKLGFRIERPATPVADALLFIHGAARRLDEPNYLSDGLRLGVGLSRIMSDRLTLQAGIDLNYARQTTTAGTARFAHVLFPLKATWDSRDVALKPTRGYYLDAEVTPYLGVAGSQSGGRIYADARAYRGLDAKGRFVVAGRLQLGSIVGSSLSGTPQDFLFYSGGGDTVRGQPYQSLGVTSGGTASGGRSFVGVSGEFRAGVTDKIGVVAFYDAGYIGGESFINGSGAWHSGAGLGLRYDTGIGPIRLDVAAPVGGTTGAGVQFYVGIGQSF